MELLFGSHVREHGNRVGRFAAAEFEPTTRHIRHIIFTPDDGTGSQQMACSLSAISLVHDDGEIELVPYSDTSGVDPMPAVSGVSMLTPSTRLISDGREVGRLTGFEVDPAERTVSAVFGRRHWWSRRGVYPGGALDYSTPGEIRIARSASQAA
jgi:hypothetical protein